jgi:ATP-dependent Clp protease ATP-binding subunit ClpC
MFEKFSDRARRVIVLAQEEARRLHHDYIGTEHLLLGLIHEGRGVAAKALESLGISLEDVRRDVGEIVPPGEHERSGHIPFTPRAKKVLELSLRESQQLGHNYIGTEHILLGLIREGEGVAAQVLVKLGADLNRVRERVLQILGAYARETGPASETAVTWEAGTGLTGEREMRIAGSPGRLEEMISRLRSIDARVAAIEKHLGLGQAGPGDAGPGDAGPGDAGPGDAGPGQADPEAG